MGFGTNSKFKVASDMFDSGASSSRPSEVNSYVACIKLNDSDLHGTEEKDEEVKSNRVINLTENWKEASELRF